MKEKLTLRNAIICAAAFIGILFFALSFAVKGVMRFEQANLTYGFKLLVWGATEFTMSSSNGSMTVKIDAADRAVFALPLIGYILILVAALGLVALLFVKLDEKVQKICLFAIAGLMVLGGVFQFFAGENIIAYFAKQQGVTMAKMREMMKEENATYGPGALAIISGIFSILAGLGVCGSQFLEDKKLIK